MRGEVVGRNRRGAVAVETPSALGKVMREEAVMPAEEAEESVLQGSRGGGGEEVGEGVSRHTPALAAVVAASLRHLQAGHPAMSRAEEAQQHPPRHKLVPQSMLLLQLSPGKLDTQAPVRGEQALHPRRTAVEEQQ